MCIFLAFYVEVLFINAKKLFFMEGNSKVSSQNSFPLQQFIIFPLECVHTPNSTWRARVRSLRAFVHHHHPITVTESALHCSIKAAKGGCLHAKPTPWKYSVIL